MYALKKRKDIIKITVASGSEKLNYKRKYEMLDPIITPQAIPQVTPQVKSLLLG